MMSTPTYIFFNLNDRLPINNPIYNPDLENNINECRICLESHGNLISVCACKGTCEFVHEECIVKWIQQFHNNREKCEICNSEYNLELIELDNEYFCEKKIILGFVCYFILLFISFAILLIIWL